MRLIRSFFFCCLAMLAAAVSFAMPASAATERILPAYELTAPDLAIFDLVAAPEVAVIAERRLEEGHPGVASLIDPGPIARVYLLSWRTDGRSLADYHLRC